MTTNSPWLTRHMPALCAGTWLLILAAAIWDLDAHWPLRILLTVNAVALVTQIVRGPAPSVALSPFLPLALIILGFFSLIPASVRVVAAGTAFLAVLPEQQRLFAEFFSGRGEFIILQFSAMCLTATALLNRQTWPRLSSATGPGIADAAASPIAKGAVIVILSLSLFLFVQQFSANLNNFLDAGIGREIKDGIPPILSFAFATFCYIAAKRDSRWRIPTVFLGLIVFGALISVIATKIAVFILISCIVLFVVTKRLAIRPIVATGFMAALVLLGAITIHGYLRNPNAGLLLFNPVLTLGDLAISQKLVMRQLFTTGCLQTVLEKRLHGTEPENSFYFVAAIVPRMIWRDKPNLSRGEDYARDYCGLPARLLTGKSPQNFSVTLLGQPIIQAGLAGLVTAQLFLLVTLGLVTVICLRAGSSGIITLTALLPWLGDFDQSLMLYIANALKMFLYMSPVLIALVLALRRLPDD